MNYKLKTRSKKLLADTLTPVNIYLKLRDIFAGSILLESSDYHGHENSLSFICCDPIASFQLSDNTLDIRLPDGKVTSKRIDKKSEVIEALDNFKNTFQVVEAPETKSDNCGLFGYLA